MRLFARVYPNLQSGVNVGTNSELYWIPPKLPRNNYAAADITRIVLARTIKGMDLRPRFENDTRNGIPRTYASGGWNLNVVIDEHMRGHVMGIPAPNMKPNVTAVGGGTISGSFVPYYRYVDGFTGRFGPLSTPGDLITLNGTQQRSWNNVPQEADVLDDSVTHVQGLVDDGSGVARVAWTKEIGAPATFVENVATLSLGQAAPPSFQAFPAQRRIVSYHDILFGFGNSQFPERGFISAIGEYEHWEGTFVSSNGEPVIGAFATDDVVIYGSFEKIYRTQGFIAQDFGRRVEKPDIGFIGPDGFANVHGRILAPTTVGTMLYDGAWHNLMKESMASEWREQLVQFPNEYRDAQGFYDPEADIYTFGPVPWLSKFGDFDIFTTSTAVVFWVLDCKDLFPETGNDYRAKWYLFILPRIHTSKALWTSPATGVPVIAHGAQDGQIREENYLGDRDDDGSVKRIIIEPAYVSAVEGGFPDDGANWERGWSYMQSSDKNWDAYFKAGSTNAFRQFDLQAYRDVMAASAPLESEGAFDTEPIAIHQHLLSAWPLSGQNIGQRIIIDNPHDEMRYSGFGVQWTPGINLRALVQQLG